jgi:hypothetical protein
MPTSLQLCDLYGGYGITVITGVCGTLNSGSIPGSRPDQPAPMREHWGCCCLERATGNRKTEPGVPTGAGESGEEVLMSVSELET